MRKINLLFLTLVEINSIDERGIYQDLLRKFAAEGHHVTIVTPVERRKKINTTQSENGHVKILQVKTLNIQKTNILEKGIGTLAIEYQYLSAIKTYCSDSRYDLILYSTPPITFSKIIAYIKKKDNAISYLLLKDIFPQNAVDMKMIKKGSLLHRYFTKKEKKLYAISDYIGCMSKANVDFVLEHNPDISLSKIEVNPNSIEPNAISLSQENKIDLRKRYGIPIDKKVLVYGGNLGKPQGLDVLLNVIATNATGNAFFLIVGNGTEYERLKHWFQERDPQNAALVKGLPKKDYDLLLSSCDIGLIFLHKDFTIPNFPSRLLSYLEMKIPVIAVTDSTTDIGEIVERKNCGRKALAANMDDVNEVVQYMLDTGDLKQMGENGWKLLQEEYLVEKSYKLIIDKLTA